MNNGDLQPGKWAGLVVVGKKITEEQAQEIIVRTSGLYFRSNNHKFVQGLYEHIFKKKLDHKVYHASICDFSTNSKEINSAMKRYGILTHLKYLENRQIVSSYIGGPHGWCNWDGTIFTNSYNVGKYPPTAGIFEEWKEIAREFPYLDLKCQLWNKEVSEDGNTPCIQYNVKGGNVEVVLPPEDLYVYPGSIDIHKIGCVMSGGNHSEFECGCSLEHAIEVLDAVEEKLQNDTKKQSVKH